MNDSSMTKKLPNGSTLEVRLAIPSRGVYNEAYVDGKTFFTISGKFTVKELMEYAYKYVMQFIKMSGKTSKVKTIRK